MDSGHDNIEEEKADRLSNLPDGVIHKILSFIDDIEDAVKIMALSSRYRFIWTTMPYLNFDYNFPRMQNFVDYILKHRNNQKDVSSLKLNIGIREFTEPSIKELVGYAFSHNIQRVEVTCLPGWVKEIELIEFPLLLFSSKSLEHLSLNNWTRDQLFKLKVTSVLELPALTTLYLEGVTFYNDDANCSVVNGLFSNCSNLKNLTLKRCKTDYRTSLSICHPGLSNLTLYDIRGRSVNVVAPQLENLTIRYDDHSGTLEHVISAPNLATFAYRGPYPLDLSTDGFHYLKEADIRVLADYLDVDVARQMVGLLQLFHNAKFLTLNLEIIELLSESVELISHQPCPFVNLESLTIYPEVLYDSETRRRPKGKVNMSAEVRNYFLDSSPGASVTMFSREEMIAEKNFALAQEYMAHLRVLLEEEKANNIKTYDRENTNRSGETQIDEGDVNAKMQLGDILSSYWGDLNTQLKQRKATVCPIINMLTSIEYYLGELPATKRAMIQTRFSSLCAEVKVVMSNITKMHDDENQSRTSAFFQQLATIN